MDIFVTDTENLSKIAIHNFEKNQETKILKQLQKCHVWALISSAIKMLEALFARCANHSGNVWIWLLRVDRRSMPLTFWSRLLIMLHDTSTTSMHWCLHRHTCCHWLEAPTEKLASTGGRRYGSTNQCLSILNPGPLVVEIAMTLSRSSAAVSEWAEKCPSYGSWNIDVDEIFFRFSANNLRCYLSMAKQKFSGFWICTRIKYFFTDFGSEVEWNRYIKVP